MCVCVCVCVYTYIWRVSVPICPKLGLSPKKALGKSVWNMEWVQVQAQAYFPCTNLNKTAVFLYYSCLAAIWHMPVSCDSAQDALPQIMAPT
jgi:hypothetical protein